MNNASLELGGDNWAAKDTKLLASTVSDDSGRFYPREFTFTRGSNLSATRVNEDGLIEKGQINFLTYSNDFNQWTKSGATATGGQSGYDGSSDAWLITKSGGAFDQVLRNVSSSGVNTISFYAKAGTLTSLYFRGQASSNIPDAKFNLSDGSLTSSTNVISASSEDIGSGWYRLKMTFSSTVTNVTIYPDFGQTTAGTIYIQDAMLNQGLAALPYIESGASAAKAGILENEPRVDYSSGAPSLLLEPSRTNLIGYSEYKASGNFTNSTPSYNAASSPEGLQNATEMFDNSTNGQHRVPIGSFSVTSGTNYTISAFVKNNDIGYCYLLLEGGFTQTRYYFNLSTGQAITSGLEVENFENGWYRIYVTQSAAASGTGSAYLNMSNNGVSPIYVGSNQSLYFYGFQAEQGSYPTSYIPNHSGGSVTRNFDYSIVESLGYSSTCTFYYEFNTTTGRNTSSPFAEIGKDQSNKIWIKGASANSPQFSVQGNGIFSGSISVTNEVSGINKIAVQWSSGVGVVFSNGVKQNNTLTNSNTSQNIDFIVMKGQGTSHDSKQLLFFEEALSDADCITLTTI